MAQNMGKVLKKTKKNIYQHTEPVFLSCYRKQLKVCSLSLIKVPHLPLFWMGDRKKCRAYYLYNYLKKHE